MEKSRIYAWLSIWVWLLTLSSGMVSCKKDEGDPVKPIVKLYSPYNNQQYSIFDTIFIHVEVEHSTPIVQMSFQVTDDNEKPLLPVNLFSTNETKVTVKTFLVLNNRYIDDSHNFLHIKIEDEENVYNYWYDITILPLEKRLEDLLVVSGSGNENSLSLIHLQGSTSKLLDWNSEYIGGYYDSKNKIFSTSGSLIDGIMAYSLTDSTVLWEVNTVPGNSLPRFTCFTASTGKIAAGIREGYIESYNAVGIKIFKSSELTNGSFRRIIHYKNFIASVFKNYTTPTNRLIVFNYPAGNIYDSIDLQGEVVDIIPADNMELYLIMNEDGNINLWSYNFNQKSLLFRDVITTGEARLVSGNYENMFLLDGSSVLWYKPASGSSVRYLESEGINTVAFDSLNNSLYLGKLDSLIRYSLPSTSPNYRLKLQNSIKDIEFIYNK